MKKFLLAFSLITISFAGWSQAVTNYSFTATSGTFTALTGGTTKTLASGTADEGYFNAIPIGFDFWYMGTRYTTLSASTNGWLSLGANITSPSSIPNLSTGGSPRPVLAPLWDNIDLQAATNMSYKTTGTSPNRIFTIEYLNVLWYWDASASVISFQVQLHETSGIIQFVYRPESGAVTSSAGASIGISATATGNGNYLSLNNSGTNPSASSTTNTTNISTKPANGQTYSFIPKTTSPPTNLTFDCIKNTSMTLNWVNNGSNRLKTAVYKSTDNVTYSYVTAVSPTVTTCSVSSLSAGTGYFWNLYSVSEGYAGTPLNGTQATQSLNITSSSSTVCKNGTVTLTLGAGYFGTIQWQSSPNGTAWSNIPGETGTAYTTPPLTSNMHYRVVITNGTCTENSAGVQISVNPLGGTATVTPNPVCTGSNATISLSGSAGSVQWQSSQDNSTWGNMAGATSATYTVGPVTDTIYYRAILSNASCPNEMSTTIKVNTNYIPSTPGAISGPSSMCTGSTYSLSVAPVTYATTYNWAASAGFVIQSGQGTSAITVLAGPSNGTITVTAGNTCGTSTVTAKSITVSSTPPIGSGTISGPPTSCAGYTQTYSTTTVSGATSYVWSGPAGSVVTGGQNTATASITFGSTSGNVTVTPSNGCLGTSSTYSVTLSVSPTANAGTDVSVCPGGSATLSASGGTVYTWTPSTGLSNPNISNPVATPASATTYTVTVGDGSGCNGFDNVTVGIHSLPNANAGSDVSFCPGGSSMLNASGGTSYQWTPSTGLSASNISNPVASPASTTTYTVAVTGSTGCTANDQVTVTVYPVPNINAGNDAAMCPGGFVQINASGGTSYSWSPSAGLSDPAIFDPVAMPAATTTYVVTVIDANGCSGTDDIIVTVNSLPTANAGSDVSVCSGSGTTLSATGNGSFSWSPAVDLSCSNCPNPVATVTANTTYTVTVTNSCGTASDEVTVSIGSAPSVNAGADVSICAGDSAALNAVGSGTFSWATSAGLSCTNCPNPKASPGATTTYTVTVTDVCGTGTDEITVTVDPLPATPVITMNGQTLNSTTGNSYQWYLNSGIISGATNQSYMFTQNGIYSVCITNTSGCEACSPGYTVTVTGIEDPVSATGVHIFPNPTTGVITVALSGELKGDCSIYIMNIPGEVVFRDPAVNSKENVSVDMTGASSGIYFLKLVSANGPVIHKIIKQ